MTYRTTTDREVTLKFFSRGGGKGYQGTKTQGDIAGLMGRLGTLSNWDSLPYGRREEPAEGKMLCTVYILLLCCRIRGRGGWWRWWAQEVYRTTAERMQEGGGISETSDRAYTFNEGMGSATPFWMSGPRVILTGRKSQALVCTMA